MRLVVTADIHFNHPRSRTLAEDLIEQINRAGGDVLLLVGDTAVNDGDGIEQCLSRFRFNGTKLFVAGNHELWTAGPDSYELFHQTIPSRVRALGWIWLQDEPFKFDDIAIVGSIGWYDYTFAQKSLGIPKRFYAAKISPGAAERLGEYKHLFEPGDDISLAAHEVIARWNDGRFVRLHRSDEEFLEELLDQLAKQLDDLRDAKRIIAAIHHLPFAELLPPPHSAQWDFAKAYLGSARIGQVLLQHPNVTDLLCGHSHFPAAAQVQNIRALNIGSGYRSKTFRIIDL